MFTLADTFLLNILFSSIKVNLTATITEDGRLVAYNKKDNSFIEGIDLFKIAISRSRGIYDRPEAFYSLVSAVKKRAAELGYS